MNQLMRRCAASIVGLVVIYVFSAIPTAGAADQAATPTDIASLSKELFTERGPRRQRAVEALVATGDKRLIPTFVLATRWTGDERQITEGLSTLTGTTIKTWHDAFEWQEAHPEILPHPTYRALKLGFLRNIDTRFMDFLEGTGTDRASMKIRLEEISWGGVRVDGIPSLDNPALIPAAEADYLRDDDLVFAVSINGDNRAYPLRIMGWHEMFNDVIGGVPVALAYCTLCGAGILFETRVEGREKPFVFGSSGFLYRSNKLMFDRGTKSLWNQFTGKPVSGALVNDGIALTQRPVLITNWKTWKAQHPDTKVLSLDTGHSRDYGSGVVYNDYFSSPDLMFPARVTDETFAKRKEFIFGIREFGAAKAWPISAFADTPVINDRLGQTDVVLIGDATTRSVRAYERAGKTFNAGRVATVLSSAGGTWRVTENALVGSDGQKLPRVAGHVAYWFAWNNYLGPRTELYQPPS